LGSFLTGMLPVAGLNGGAPDLRRPKNELMAMVCRARAAVCAAKRGLEKGPSGVVCGAGSRRT
jgi:hypothetical protein